MPSPETEKYVYTEPRIVKPIHDAVGTVVQALKKAPLFTRR